MNLAVDAALLVLGGGVFFLITRSLRRGAARQALAVRAPLVVLWIVAYIALITLLENLLADAGLGGLVGAVRGLLIVVGVIAMLLQLVTWRRAARAAQQPAAATPTFVPIRGDISPLPVGVRPPAATGPRSTLPLFLRCAVDGLALPLRRPVLFVPFVFYMLLYALALGALGLDLEAIRRPDYAAAHSLPLTLIAAGSFPVFTLAAETTSHMAADAELGRPVSLARSLGIALGRLLNTLVVLILYVVGMVVGFMLLIVPGIVVLVRWILASHAVMVGGADIGEAFAISSRVTRGRWWRFALLLTIIATGARALSLALDTIPHAGLLASGWLDFAWITIAFTLAYIRMGGPVE